MAGMTVNVSVNDREVQDLLRQVAARIGNATPAWKEIGEVVLESVQRNFEEHRAPDGTPWKPLADETAREKAARGRSASDILIDTRTLMGSIHPKADATGVTVGTNVIYAAVHQLGADFSTIRGRRRVKIPARPYLGIREMDWPEIRETLSRYILEGR